MVTSSERTEASQAPPCLLEQLNRSIRTRLFDTYVEDVHSACLQYKLGELGAEDFTAIVAERLGLLRRCRRGDALCRAIEFTAQALVDSIIEDLGGAEAITDALLERTAERLVERMRADVTMDTSAPESDSGTVESRRAGTEFANTNSNSKALGINPEIRNDEFEEETRE
jgi:hypothetical protein